MKRAPKGMARIGKLIGSDFETDTYVAYDTSSIWPISVSQVVTRISDNRKDSSDDVMLTIDEAKKLRQYLDEYIQTVDNFNSSVVQ